MKRRRAIPRDPVPRRVSPPEEASDAIGSGAKAALMLPHERDETALPEAPEGRGDRRRVRQAALDVEHGLVDTEARGTPSNVPRGKRRRGRGVPSA